jgi:hypothetical protein
MLAIIVELRSALQGIGNAIEAVERLAVAQLGENAWEPRKSVPPKTKKRANASLAKRRGRVVALLHSPEVLCAEHKTPVHDNQPAAL